MLDTVPIDNTLPIKLKNGEIIYLNVHPESGLYYEYIRDEHETKIYYLMAKEDFSSIHTLLEDLHETWEFYCGGSAAEIHVLDPGTKMDNTFIVGDPRMNQQASGQIEIKPNMPFCAKLANQQSWGIFICTVKPPFDFKKWQLPSREELLKNYPNCKSLIQAFTRDQQPENNPAEIIKYYQGALNEFGIKCQNGVYDISEAQYTNRLGKVRSIFNNSDQKNKQHLAAASTSQENNYDAVSPSNM